MPNQIPNILILSITLLFASLSACNGSDPATDSTNDGNSSVDEGANGSNSGSTGSGEGTSGSGDVSNNSGNNGDGSGTDTNGSGGDSVGSNQYREKAYQANEITSQLDITYGSGVTDTGEIIDLKLDVFSPPDASSASRPVIVLFHGGAFQFGNKELMHNSAREWAQFGYIAASVQYRLASSFLSLTTQTVRDAAADGQLAISWLRANAGTYNLDVNRIGALGSSAGGGIVLLTATNQTFNTDRILPSFNPVPNAVIATGATLNSGIETGEINSDMPLAPALIHHHENDSVTGEPVSSASNTCDLWITAGLDCEVIQSAGTGHVTNLGPESEFGELKFLPFLSTTLDLSNANSP